MENDNGLPKRVRILETEVKILTVFINDFKKYFLLFIITLLGSIAFNVYSHVSDENMASKRVIEIEKKLDLLLKK